MAIYINDEEIRQLIRIEDAIEAVRGIMRDLAEGKACNCPRQRPRTTSTMLHVLCAAGERIGSLGLKAYTTRQDGNRFLFLLFSDKTGDCDAVIEADWLGRFRTGAASGVATRYLAHPDAETVGIIGTGRHALTQLLAVCAVRQIKQAFVWSPTPEHRIRFAEENQEAVPISLKLCESAESLVRQSDILCTITKASTPVLKREWVQPGTHINAAGSNSLSRQEIDPETLRGADILVIDSIEQAKMECGDLFPLVQAGEKKWDDLIELSTVVSSGKSLREGSSQISIFESHGLGLWDIAVGKLIYDRACEAGVGTKLPF